MEEKEKFKLTIPFFAIQPLLLSIFAQLSGTASSIALVEELNDLAAQTNLRQMIGFETDAFAQPLTLNQSSFSRANASRSYRLWKYCFHKLGQTAKVHCQANLLEGLGRVVAVDGTLFDCLPKMSWAIVGTERVGRKLYVILKG